ncbi:DUF1902 domain-containing protein [Methylobrevis albus]|uniref:DUF1902 domain-containing protein n=1 Tax=Methylobrevis albus TaxID=2793297 RepID=A0A931MYI0_9HYPH|nr:DUF1902 domain-containing protein [Methylobrevis albus]MBH0236741.1 DUF1902 domain-containing protein [Methylobrevis albus]
MDTSAKVVTVAFDAESEVWFIKSSDLPGLNGEADTIAGLTVVLPALVADLFGDGINVRVHIET